MAGRSDQVCPRLSSSSLANRIELITTIVCPAMLKDMMSPEASFDKNPDTLNIKFGDTTDRISLPSLYTSPKTETSECPEYSPRWAIPEDQEEAAAFSFYGI